MSEEVSIEVNTDELEVREAEIREVNLEERTVSGIAMPYGEVTNRLPYKERFERGAFGDVVGTAVYFGHDHRSGGLPVGRITKADDGENGLDVTVSISKTAKGDEVYELLRDGTLSKFSVGFVPVKSRRDGDVIVRESGILRELSIVDFPAYVNASVSEVRSVTDSPNNKEDIIMSEVNEVNDVASEVAEIREAVGDLGRKFSVLQEQGTEVKGGAVVESQFRTAEEWLLALADNDQTARMEVRAYTGGTFADNDNATRPAWLNEKLQLVKEQRPLTELFGRAPLPAKGMSYEYPQVTAVTGTVGKQAAEGDDLPYMEVTSGRATATIDTYGGYTSLSKQEIKRSEVGMLEINIEHLFNQYAKATEKAVRDSIVGASGTQTLALGAAHAAATPKQFTAAVFDAAGLIEDNAKGPQAEVVIVSRDVFRNLGLAADTTGRPVFAVNGDGANTWGSVDYKGVKAVVGGLPVVVVGGLPAGYMAVISRDALKVREDGITSLRDENVINLTEDFSVHGLLSVDVRNTLAIVRVTTTA